jgi:acetyl esterase/lipase
MNRLLFPVVVLLLVGTGPISRPSLPLAQELQVAPQPLAIEGAAAHIYKTVDGVELRLHAFAPANHSPAERRPAIVLLFGGGFAQGSIVQFVAQARHLAQRGMVAIVADYRVRGRHGSSPYQAIADAKSAIRWIRSHATSLGIDPDRIAAGGGSAGGFLALTTAMIDAFDETTEDQAVRSTPNALVLFNPSVDSAKEVAKDRFGDRGREASPLHHVRAGLPPIVIFHGKADTTVPYSEAEAFCKAVNSARSECQLFGYEGATHGFFNASVASGKWYRETLTETDRFLTKLGYLPPAPAEVR